MNILVRDFNRWTGDKLKPEFSFNISKIQNDAVRFFLNFFLYLYLLWHRACFVTTIAPTFIIIFF